MTEAEVVADSDVVTGCKSGSEVRDTPPPGVFSQGCDFMGVIFRRSVRM